MQVRKEGVTGILTGTVPVITGGTKVGSPVKREEIELHQTQKTDVLSRRGNGRHCDLLERTKRDPKVPNDHIRYSG